MSRFLWLNFLMMLVLRTVWMMHHRDDSSAAVWGCLQYWFKRPYEKMLRPRLRGNDKTMTALVAASDKMPEKISVDEFLENPNNHPEIRNRCTKVNLENYNNPVNWVVLADDDFEKKRSEGVREYVQPEYRLDKLFKDRGIAVINGVRVNVQPEDKLFKAIASDASRKKVYDDLHVLKDKFREKMKKMNLLNEDESELINHGRGKFKFPKSHLMNDMNDAVQEYFSGFPTLFPQRPKFEYRLQQQAHFNDNQPIGFHRDYLVHSRLLVTLRGQGTVFLMAGMTYIEQDVEENQEIVNTIYLKRSEVVANFKEFGDVFTHEEIAFTCVGNGRRDANGRREMQRLTDALHAVPTVVKHDETHYNHGINRVLAVIEGDSVLAAIQGDSVVGE